MEYVESCCFQHQWYLGPSSGTVSMLIYINIVLDLELVIVSLSLCVYFCCIHQRIHNRRTVILLQNSVCVVGINASIMGL